MGDGAPLQADAVAAGSRSSRSASDPSGVLAEVRIRLVRDRVSLSAGSLAYHWFLALFPAVIAVVSLLTVVQVSSSTISRLTHALDASLPSGVSSVFTSAIRAAGTRTHGSVLVLVIGVVAALWSASGGFAALQQALDVAYEVPVDRPYLSRHLHSIPLMAAAVVLGGGGAALIVFGQPIGAGISGHVGVTGSAFVVAWTVVRWLLTTVAVMVFISGCYYYAPNLPEGRWRWISPGSLLATGIFLAASFGFSLYVAHFGSYSRTYGTFAGVAILIFWLYLTGLAILVGGELNAAIDRAAGAPQPSK